MIDREKTIRDKEYNEYFNKIDNLLTNMVARITSYNVCYTKLLRNLSQF